MMNPFKQERAPKDKPSQERMSPTTLTLWDLTDVDLEQVQGAKVQHQDLQVQKYVAKSSPILCS